MESLINEHRPLLFLIIPSTIAFAGLIWRVLKHYPSKIIMHPTAENQFLIDECPSLKEYRPTPWLFNGHLLTMFGARFRPLPSINYERIILPVDDMGGTIAMDWHHRPSSNQPILLILHGLTGGSQNEYVRWMIKAASSRSDLCCVVAHARGCGRSSLTSAQSFCAANTDDVRAAVKYLRSIIDEKTPIFAIGYSLGAGILAKYLGEEADRCPLQGAVICCASFDMHLTTEKLERWLHFHLYNRRLTGNLLHYLRTHEQHFTRSDSRVNLKLNDAYRSQTIRDYDRHVIVPQYGFRDVEHYYDEASPKHSLNSIRIPSLILSAMDDPICPIEGLPIETIEKNPSLIAVLTLEGGHVSYLQGWWPKSFSYENVVAVDFFQARLKQMKYKWTSTASASIDIELRQ